MKKIFSIIALSIIMLCAANTTNAYTNKSDNANATETVVANAITNSNFDTEIAEPAKPDAWLSVGCWTLNYIKRRINGGAWHYVLSIDLCGIKIVVAYK